MNASLTTHTSSGHAPRLADRRLGGLDGLRAVAVTLVVVYHVFPGSLTGGFIGVDVFFVVSGFLITSLLIREHRRSGTISLGRFWLRRSRRLLPALALVLLAGSAAAWIVGGDALVGLGRQVVGALTFSLNWLALAFGGSYVDQTSPEVFMNLWSLAVEEQFYIVWPIALLALLGVVRSMRSLALGFVLVGLASAGLMLLLHTPGEDPTRVYYGTDTHAFGLAFGAALAFALANAPAARDAWGRGIRVLGWATGLLSLATLATIAVVATEYDPATYPWWLGAASVAAVGASWAGAIPGSWFGRALDVAPMRWIGQRSYGIYLWHWPVYAIAIVVLPHVPRSGPESLPLGCGVLVCTLVAATLSYRFLEQPVRTLGYRTTVRRFVRALQGTATPAPRLRRWSAITGAALVVIASGIGTAGILADPGQSSAAQEIGEAVDPGPALPPAPAPPGPMSMPVGDQIMAVGDSVMLASIEELQAAYPGIWVDASVSRGLGAGADIIESLAAQGALRQFVVVGLGTNGFIDTGDLDRILAVMGPSRYLILVDAYADRPWTESVNADLAYYADALPNVELAHWHDLIAGNLHLLAGDQVHPGEEGSWLYVQAVTDAFEALIDSLPPQKDPPAPAPPPTGTPAPTDPPGHSDPPSPTQTPSPTGVPPSSPPPSPHPVPSDDAGVDRSEPGALSAGERVRALLRVAVQHDD